MALATEIGHSIPQHVLQYLHKTNPDFWDELVNMSPPDEDLPQQEDDEPASSGISDDVDVPIEAILKS